MTANILRRIALPEIPSASGIEIIGNSIYIIGDDSPFLFELNADYSIKSKIRLFESVYERVPKSEKPDLEGMAHLRTEKMNLLLICGSGSIEETRDVIFLVDLNKNFAVKKFPSRAFYTRCRTVVEELGGGILNLEGVCFRRGWLHFFHRGNITGVNVIISLLWKDFLRFESSSASFRADKIELPSFQTIYPGISGATLIPETNEILFTASLEQTQNVIDDGPVHGSLIGILHYSKYPKKNPETAMLSLQDSLPPPKLESIAIKSVDKKEIIALCVSDRDGSRSELIKVKISVD